MEICNEEISMESKEELKQLLSIIEKVKDDIDGVVKSRSNKHYKKQLEMSIKELNRSYKFLRAKIIATNNDGLKSKFKTVGEYLSVVISNYGYDKKLDAIKKLEIFWPDLEIEFESLKLSASSFVVPTEIPMTEYRTDLEESIKDFDNDCSVSSLVLCRRAYEGALVSFYISKMGKAPIEEFKCKNCGALIRDKSYMGIAKLHNWAIENHLITERLKQAGFLLTDMGAGAAHPPLTEFPRDKELARLGINTTIVLLKELHTSKPVK